MKSCLLDELILYDEQMQKSHMVSHRHIQSDKWITLEKKKVQNIDDGTTNSIDLLTIGMGVD